jgi:putative transposase
MREHRDTDVEIATKLKEADDLIAEGRLDKDIAKSLGISVMTYHRWRKTRESSQLAGSSDWAESNGSPTEQTRRIRELQLENSRFRRLVTDLLLEKMSLEEAMLGHSGPGDKASDR